MTISTQKIGIRTKELQHYKQWIQKQPTYFERNGRLFDYLSENVGTLTNQDFYRKFNELKKGYSAWKKLILDQGDYRYSVVITFRNDLSENAAYKYLNLILHFLNSKIFGRNYKKNEKFINGFSYLEHQKSERIHFHLMILDHDDFHIDNKPTLKQHFDNTIDRVVRHSDVDEYENRKRENKITQNISAKHELLAIDRKHVSFKDVTEKKGLAGYDMKTFTNNDADFIKIFSVDGVV